MAQLHRKGSLQLLRAEALLRDALAEVVIFALSTAVSVYEMADRLRDAFLSVLLGGRRNARRVARETLVPQLAYVAAMNSNLPADIPPMLQLDAAYDRQRALLIASSFTTKILERYTDYRAEGLSGDAAKDQAFGDEDHRVDMIATTENSEAFSRERDDELDSYALTEAYEAEKRNLGALIPFKWWNATLDKRTCHICEGLDGKIALLGRPFPGGLVPGAAHPRCRCTEDILLLPAWYQYEPEAMA